MIDGVKVRGTCFVEPTNLRFFHEADQRVAVVYGRNGSGKSTISQAFSTFHDAEDTNVSTSNMDSEQGDSERGEGLEVELILSQELGVVALDQPRRTALVFNEAFVDQQVKFRGTGLDTVVLFGEQAELQDQINAQRHRVADREKEVARAVEVREGAEKENNRKEARIMRALKDDWAERSRKILESTNATLSWSRTRVEIANTVPAEGEPKVLLRQLDERIDRYLRGRAN